MDELLPGWREDDSCPVKQPVGGAGRACAPQGVAGHVCRRSEPSRDTPPQIWRPRCQVTADRFYFFTGGMALRLPTPPQVRAVDETLLSVGRGWDGVGWGGWRVAQLGA